MVRNTRKDRHRLTIRGRSSFAKAHAALQLLERYPASFAGVISVIDPAVPPADLLSFFSNYSIPRLDFLLPDANYDSPPAGRIVDPDLYTRWLVEAFDLWFDAYPDLSIRCFESLLSSIVGLPSGTDAFGLGDVSLLTIETDGTYHDLDVLKITEPGRTALNLDLFRNSIGDAAVSEVIAVHRALLLEEGLAQTCRACPEMSVCGGGAVPHRFGSGSFDHPTVYCGEMLALIAHARSRLREALAQVTPTSPPNGREIDVENFERAEGTGSEVDRLVTAWADQATEELQSSLDAALVAGHPNPISGLSEVQIRRLAVHPCSVLWSHLRRSPTPVRTLDGRSLAFDPSYSQRLTELISQHPSRPTVHRVDPLLRSPFGASIVFDKPESAVEEDQCGRTGHGPHRGMATECVCRAVSPLPRDPTHNRPKRRPRQMRVL